MQLLTIVRFDYFGQTTKMIVRKIDRHETSRDATR